MGVACQATTLAAAGLVGELEADRQEKGKDEFDKRFGVAQEISVGCLIAEVDGESAVFGVSVWLRVPYLIPRSDAVGADATW